MAPALTAMKLNLGTSIDGKIRKPYSSLTISTISFRLFSPIKQGQLSKATIASEQAVTVLPNPPSSNNFLRSGKGCCLTGRSILTVTKSMFGSRVPKLHTLHRR